MKARLTSTSMNKETEDRVDTIIREYVGKEHSSRTEADFVEWLLDERRMPEKNNALRRLWDGFSGVKRSARSFAALKRVKTLLGLPAPRRRLGSARIIAVAAAVLLLATVGGIGWIYNRADPDAGPVIRLAQREVKPRPAEAVKRETMPDNGQVWLGKESYLTYSETDDGTVYADLTGEGLFDVQLRESAAFVVRTSSLQVRVHGTRFNVKEYPGENYTTVTLYRGKVEVVLPDESLFMEPGHLLTYVHDTREVLYDVLPDKSGQQRNSLLDFERVELFDILKRLSDLHGMYMEIAEGDYLSDVLSISFENGESIEESMSLLQQLSGAFAYEITGDTVRVYSE